MWKFSNGRFAKPNIPLYNWEELGKMDPSVLRTLRHITFGRYTPSHDGAYFLDKKVRETEEGEMYLHEMDALYPILLTENRTKEEWPSEKWNFQDNYGKSIRKVHAKSNPKGTQAPTQVSQDESSESVLDITEEHIKEVFTSIKGIGNKKMDEILEKIETTELIETIESAPEKLTKEFSWFKKKMLAQLDEAWVAFKNKL
jgi:hypothetical protein